MKRLIKLIIKGYRLLPIKQLTCRYYPSCSHYVEESVEKHGPAKGLWLGMIRLLKCNQLFPGGFDPVP